MRRPLQEACTVCTIAPLSGYLIILFFFLGRLGLREGETEGAKLELRAPLHSDLDERQQRRRQATRRHYLVLSPGRGCVAAFMGYSLLGSDKSIGERALTQPLL